MSDGKQLEIIPLGGLGEFGMNLMVYRYGSDCVVIDAGMMFPGPEHLGVDAVIPDLDFLDECGTLHGVVLCTIWPSPVRITTERALISSTYPM